MSELILEAVDLEYCYPDGTSALRKVNLEVRKGEKLAILGSNGAGKSTLFMHFNGIYTPRAGSIKFQGQPISYKKKALIELRKKVGIVFQDPDSQLFSASVFQDISFGPLNLGLSEEEVTKRVRQALIDTETTDLEGKPTHLLSYGQKKRVSIAGVLAMEPEIIIFDEPTAGMDPRHSLEFIQLLNKLSSEGKTIVLSTHDVDLAYSWSDRLAIMYRGEILAHGFPGELLTRPEIVKRADLTIPWLIETHSELVKKGWLPPSTPLPKTKEDLFQNIPLKKEQQSA
ncbi:energy-coupling factor ABC transporter ATP-binding protein [Desulfosporosinus meridiei]|uniref:ABC transporter ATP-binding protein n=1 Tax=Desulfosporosinus meridiei (strain ATCC BAA-275 / DSM 13257 / KCTC 12902 / NCIMB 13706 / S10) TaxID=768704 RepID=J7IUS2_DESMD|nr:ATP-binding cassette domain-containing protein [Desulfosporosinus meridiei]AFQ45480.1 cobalt transport protein ATP-binding subunit [Desulfosporosinus meridiei DSM 13257]